MNNIKNTIKLNYNIITIFYVIISKKNRFLLVFIGFYWFLLVFIGFYCFLLFFIGFQANEFAMFLFWSTSRVMSVPNTRFAPMRVT